MEVTRGLTRERIAMLAILLILVPLSTASAQGSASLGFRLVRSIGYQFGASIQGSFSVKVTAPDAVLRVSLYLDGEQIGLDDEAPYDLHFRTGDFSAGDHQLWVEAKMENGGTLKSEKRRLIFLTAEEGIGSITNYLLPIFLIVGAVSALSLLVTLRDGDGHAFKPGVYGLAGGAVCRRCGLPFSRRVMAPNLIVGKLARCPHCGLWAIARRASEATLRVAEARFEADAYRGSYQAATQAQDWRQRIDETRFDG